MEFRITLYMPPGEAEKWEAIKKVAVRRRKDKRP